MPVSPDAPPILVLLPGMDGTGIMFEPFLEALGTWPSRVVRYPVALTSYEDCIAFARDQLPVDRPFLLLGESFSGPVALALGAERPKGLVGVVLCSTFARNPRPHLTWLAPLVRALPLPRLPLSWLRRLLLGGRHAGALDHLVDTMLTFFPSATFKGRLLAVGAVDRTDCLTRILVPILALVAAQDRLVPKAASAWLRHHGPTLDMVRLQGPHWLLQTRAAACVRAIQEFLLRNQGRPERPVPPPAPPLARSARWT
jgi:pimeloyl-ACP methyl ester carboxylesterase